MGLKMVGGGQHGGMDSAVALDYYSKNKQPTISQDGQPIMMVPEPSSHHIHQHPEPQLLERPQSHDMPPESS